MEQSVHIVIEEGGKFALDEWVNGLVVITTDGKQKTGVIKHTGRANQITEDVMVNLTLAGNLIAEGENMIRELEEALPGAHIREGVEAFYDEAKELRKKRRKEKRHAE